MSYRTLTLVLAASCSVGCSVQRGGPAILPCQLSESDYSTRNGNPFAFDAPEAASSLSAEQLVSADWSVELIDVVAPIVDARFVVSDEAPLYATLDGEVWEDCPAMAGAVFNGQVTVAIDDVLRPTTLQGVYRVDGVAGSELEDSDVTVDFTGPANLVPDVEEALRRRLQADGSTVSGFSVSVFGRREAFDVWINAEVGGRNAQSDVGTLVAECQVEDAVSP